MTGKDLWIFTFLLGCTFAHFAAMLLYVGFLSFHHSIVLICVPITRDLRFGQNIQQDVGPQQ